MSSRIRNHIRGNVVGYIALFLVVTGGTAQALDGSNTVFSDDIVNDEVRSADVRDDSLDGGGLASDDLKEGSVATSDVRDDTLAGGGLGAIDLRSDSVRTSEVLDDSLTSADVSGLDGTDVIDNAMTGDDVYEATLNTVPSANNAAQLGGLSPANYLRSATVWKSVRTIGERYPIEIGNPPCSANRKCYASLRCDPGDVLLSGGYNLVDPGTDLITARPFNANGYDQKYTMVWENNSTADELDINVLCANQ